MPEQDKVTIQAQLRWVDDDSPFVVADQFIMRHQGNLIQLVIGHTSIPLISGTVEEQQKQIHEMGSVPIYVRGRFLLDKSFAVRFNEAFGSMISHDEDNDESNG